MRNVFIAKAETVRGDDITTSFDPFADQITLRLVIELSQGIKETENLTNAVTFQIIEFRTNAVVFENRRQFEFSSDEVVWLDAGTAQDLGLQWNASDIFGFRGAVECYANGDQGLTAIDNAFDVSAIIWFRLKDVFAL